MTQRTMRNIFPGLALIVSLFIVPTQAGIVDHTLWDQILKDDVTALGFVDYGRIQSRHSRELDRYLTYLAKANLSNAPQDERLAFWINAYNAHRIRQLLTHPPLKFANEDLRLFDEKFRVAGLLISLNDIEHRIIRSDPTRGGALPNVSLTSFDPRIHFALIYGAVGSPRLIDRAYQPESVRTQLEADAAMFVNDPRFLRVEKDRLVVSSLFQWYAADFEKLGGAAAFLMAELDPLKRPDITRVESFLKSGYPDKANFQFDWTWNNRRSEKSDLAPR
jgi:hypothetical protein